VINAVKINYIQQILYPKILTSTNVKPKNVQVKVIKTSVNV